MTDIYDSYNSAFKLVTAGALVVGGVQVGTLAFKHPTKGEGRVTCFLHVHGFSMVKGTAGGYGYDKKAAALESACRVLCDGVLTKYPQLKNLDCGGLDFQRKLEDIGFNYFRGV